MTSLKRPSGRVAVATLLLLAMLAWHAETIAAQLTASWVNNTADAVGLSVERSTGSTGAFIEITTTGPTVTTYTDTTVTDDGTTYCYRVRAYDPTAYSDYSNTACGTTGQAVGLAVVKMGTGSGVVISALSGILCGTSCSGTFASGTAVTLTATPATGSTFAGWSGGGCTGTGTCTVTVTSTTAVTATFTAFGATCPPSTKADMQTPAPGSPLAGATVTFTWSEGCQVADYWLSVGTGPGGSNLYHQSQGTSLSGTVGGLPTTGQTLYVRLWSLIGGVWQFNDYTYTAFGATCTPPTKADMQASVPGAPLAGETVTFTWSTGCQVADYWLSVGTGPGGSDLYHQSQGTSLSGTVGGLPTTGQTLYVRLWSLIGGLWQFNDYTYAAFGATCPPSTKADMQTPAPGSPLAGATVTFTWSEGCQVADYWLSVGTGPGGSNLYHQSQGTSLSGTVGGLQTTGQTLYVRLWSLIGGVWQFNDYTYTAAAAVP